MKKFISFLLASILVLAMSCAAFAEDSTITVGGQSAEVTATYTVQEKFTIKIPASVAINGGTLRITADTSGILSSNCIQILVDSDNAYENIFSAFDSTGKKSVEYFIKNGSTYIYGGKTACTIPSGLEETYLDYSFLLADSSQTYTPGTYTDTLKVTASIISAY